MPEFTIILRSAALGEWRTQIAAADEEHALECFLKRMGERGVTRETETSASFLDEVHVSVAPRPVLRAVPAEPRDDLPHVGKSLAAQAAIKAGRR